MRLELLYVTLRFLAQAEIQLVCRRTALAVSFAGTVQWECTLHSPPWQGRTEMYQYMYY